MDEDKFALVEKIVKDIDNIMSKNAELNSFDIVPVETNLQNKSPVLHLENCLGLESWCVKHVFMYSYSEIMDIYFCKPKRKTLKITSFNSERLTKLLNVALLLNPDLSSLWNKRREMVLKLLLEKASELRFTRLVLTRKPKSNEVFSYRRWILDAMFQDETLQISYIENLINEELDICERASGSSPNNYHSWNHRMWLVNTLKKFKKHEFSFIVIKEFEFSQRWSSKHVSDYSCFHYRQFCIENILVTANDIWKKFVDIVDVHLQKSFIKVLLGHFPKDSNNQTTEENLLSYNEDNLIKLLLCYSAKNCSCIVDNVGLCRKFQVLFYELVINNELLKYYKHHETLWYHRRFIVHKIMLLMYGHFGLTRQNGTLVKSSCKKCNSDELCQKQAKMGRYDSNRVYSTVLFKVVISHERKFIEERRKDGDNYADRHEKYMKFVEGLNNVM